MLPPHPSLPFARGGVFSPPCEGGVRGGWSASNQPQCFQRVGVVGELPATVHVRPARVRRGSPTRRYGPRSARVSDPAAKIKIKIKTTVVTPGTKSYSFSYSCS
jgi:hypothetical protein